LEMVQRSMEISSAELVSMNQGLNAIFEAIPDIFLKINLEGRILDYKAGKNKDEFSTGDGRLSNKNLLDILTNEAREEIAQVLEKIREDKIRYNVEYFLDKDGEKRFFEARFVPLSDEEYVVIIRDISEGKKREKEMTETLHSLKLYKKITIDRELAMVELKKQINEVCKSVGKSVPYDFGLE
ncbi:MAG: PAS domain S-box protein, partial [Candidatus Omnitrophica bacterium]|nr:PAS domain S-box protein [Candidatus Omnitrophota bacterium]